MTNPTPTDWRALCAELVDAHDADEGMSVSKWTANLTAAITRARAALAQPEPQGPSEAELKTFACNWWHTFGFAKDKATCTWVIDHVAPEHFVSFSRDLLARWGRPAIEPVPQQEAE
jgi:hypothetical protein